MASKTAKEQKPQELVYVISGENPSLVNDKYVALIDRLAPAEQRDMGLIAVDADRALISEVLDELRTLPFLTKRRVVAIRDADDFISNNREILERYFDAPCPTGVLVMTVSSWPGNTRLARKLPQIGVHFEIEAPKGREIRQRLIGYAQDKYGKRLEYATADLLVELAGEDITRLNTEVDKLATYSADEKTITAGHVEALVGYNRMFNAFAVIDACLEKKAGEAVERLRKMFSEDKNADYTTVGALAFHFRRMFTAKKMMMEKVPQDVIGKRLRIWQNEAFSQIRRLTLKQIGDRLLELAETDYAIKKGLAQPRIAIEQFVLRMTAL